MIFDIKEIATNLPVQLKTGFVVQGHIWSSCLVLDVYFFALHSSTDGSDSADGSNYEGKNFFFKRTLLL